MKIVVCMLLSNPIEIVEPAVKSIAARIPMDHIIISVADRSRDILHRVIGWLPKRPTVLPGCNDRLTMAHHRFLQFDVAQQWLNGNDGWIVNVDDDDIILGHPDMRDMPDWAGIFHTDILAICTQDSGPKKAGEYFVRASKTITKPSEGDWFMGSFWGVRSFAWSRLAPVVDRVTVFEDWALAYQAIKHGWKDWHIPQILQMQRLRNYVEVATSQQATGNTWERYVERLRYNPHIGDAR